MAKRSLRRDLSILEGEIIDTLIAGHKEWRPDLRFPQSYSDMQGPYIETGYVIHTGYYRNGYPGRYDDVVPRYYRVY